MSFENVVHEIYASIKAELKKEQNMEILKHDIIKPIVQEAMNHIYPYLFAVVAVIIVLFLSIFSVLFLNLRLIIKDK